MNEVYGRLSFPAEAEAGESPFIDEEDDVP